MLRHGAYGAIGALTRRAIADMESGLITLVDSLLERKEFTELWVMKWAELLQIRSAINNNTSAYL